jgi:hypothetical protein
MLRTLALILWIFALEADAADSCSTISPLKTAKTLFSEYSDFYYVLKPGLETILTPDFYKLQKQEIKCKEQNGICNLEYDPWLGAQDGEISEPKWSMATRIQSNVAIATLRYKFTNDGRAVRANKVKIVLARSNVNECWRVNDVITPTGDSLSEIYTKS